MVTPQWMTLRCHRLRRSLRRATKTAEQRTNKEKKKKHTILYPARISNSMLAGKSHFSRVFLSLITVLLFTGTGTSRILNNTEMENATQLTVSCINCNSLNMSAVGGQSQLCKIYGIAKLRTDIIFMSDIRLSTKNKISCSNEMTKKFSNTPYGSYDFYFNSSKNKRGVAILVKKILILQSWIDETTRQKTTFYSPQS
jgi:hypothetical protein